MTQTASQILADMVLVLRETGAFALVTLGQSASATETPRAAVICEGQDKLTPDDTSGNTWTRLRASIRIRTRSSDATEATNRILGLCEQAATALLDDPHRGGLCHDLPIGKATAIGQGQLDHDLRRPEAGATLDVRCHFETEQT